MNNSALSDPEFNSFELLRDSAEDAGLRKLLEVYAFGTIGDYAAHRDELRALSKSEVLKLRQMTLIGLCSGRKRVGFEELVAALRIQEEEELVDVLVALDGSGLISYRIDEVAKEIVLLEEPASRDLRVKGQGRPLEVVTTGVKGVEDVLESLRGLQGKIRNVRGGLRGEPERARSLKRPLES